MATVLHVTQPTEAGVGSYVAGLGVDQVRRGWRVVVASPSDGRLAAELARHDVAHVRWPAARSPDPRAATETWRLRRLIDRICPDVIHLHSSKAGLAGRLAVRGGIPTLFQPHGWSWLAAPPGMVAATLAWEMLAARWTARFVVVGAGEAAHASDRGLRGRFSLVRNGIDLTRFQPASERDSRAARDALGLARDAPLAVCVGRVTRQKGQDLLIEAWRRVQARVPGARLAIVGGGGLLDSLRRSAPAGVAMVGPVDDPRAWYAAADVVVLPSRWEGLPLTLLEALATGRSVVGTDIPGIAGEVPPGAGETVPADDAAALASAVGDRLGNLDLARAEGAAAASYAAAEVDIRRAHNQLADITARVGGWR